LFDTVELDLPWPEFLHQLAYAPNWNLRGLFLTIRDAKFSQYGGAESYARFLQQHLAARRTDLFAPLFPDELRAEIAEIAEIGGPVAPDPTFVAAVNHEMQIIEAHAHAGTDADGDPPLTNDSSVRMQNAKARDAAFAVVVRRAYGDRCALYGAGARGPLGQVEVEAAHLYPKSRDGSDDVRNGLCLCRRHHWALDVGWFAIADDYTVIVRAGLPANPDHDFIRATTGQRIRLPDEAQLRPHHVFLQAHRTLRQFA
jgi:HNH endonuclease